MSFTEAIQTCFRKYVDFSGRARPSEYWWWVLFVVVAQVVAFLIDDSSTLGGLISLGLFLPGLAVSVRRLHDTGKSGWFLLLALIPLVGAILLLVFMIQTGDPGPNQYGEPVPARLVA